MITYCKCVAKISFAKKDLVNRDFVSSSVSEYVSISNRFYLEARLKERFLN